MASVRKTTSCFIAEANAIHNYKYDYSLTEYNGSRNDVIIICPVHGEFLQKPRDHLTGKGCKLCGKQSSIIKRTYTTETFIEKAKSIYGNQYTYNKCVFTKSDTDVVITCKEHGDFSKSPKSFLRGVGCRLCANDRISKSKKMKHDAFILKCKLIHKDMDFDYSQTIYKSMEEDVTIHCNIHGDFTRNAKSFLHWSSCPECAKGGFKPSKTGYLYLMAYFYESGKVFQKYGISNYPEFRLKYCLKKNKHLDDGIILDIFKFKNGHHAERLEADIKDTFKDIQGVSKEIMVDGYTETLPISFYTTIKNYIIRSIDGFNAINYYCV